MNSSDSRHWTEKWAFILGLIALAVLLALAILAAFAAARMGIPISYD